MSVLVEAEIARLVVYEALEGRRAAARGVFHGFCCICDELICADAPSLSLGLKVMS